jgi:cytosine/adenosine deaminase-related metal-dependent hydrolase
MYDILIKNGSVITMDPGRRVLEPGVVAITGNRIAAVGSPGEFSGAAASREIDATGMCVLPGLVDSHGHAGHSLAKTAAEGPDQNWLEVVENIYLRYSTEDYWYVEAQLGALERLRFGVTTAYSMLGNMPRADDPVYSFRHMEGAKTVGIRDIVGIGPANPPWPKKYSSWNQGKQTNYESDLETAIKTTETVLKAWRAGGFGRTMVHVSPSRVGNLPGLSDEKTLWQHQEIKRLANEYGTAINSHAYAGNIKYARERLDILGPNVVLAHCTGISDEEVRILADTGTNVSHCPSARAMTRDRCPAVELLEAGANVALGTDGTGPDRTFDLFKEFRAVMWLHRAHFRDASYMPPGKVLEMATIDAAKSLGLEKEVGSLEKGKLADVTLVNIQRPHLYPWSMPVHRMVYEASGQDVDTVIVDGEVLMEKGVIKSIDENSVLKAAQREYGLALDRSDGWKYTAIPPNFWGKAKY